MTTLDLRKPIGILFALLGALLAAYGLFSSPGPGTPALHFNLNLIWGSAMFLFGACLLGISLRR